MKNSIFYVSAIGACLLACACNGGSTATAPAENKPAEVTAMLGAQNSDVYTIIKGSTNVTGYIVVQSQNTGQYMAVRYDVFTAGMTYSQWVAAAGGASTAVVSGLTYQDNSYYQWNPTQTSYVDANGAIQYTGGYDYISEIDYVGQGYTFEDGSPRLKDLETMGASMEAAQINQLRQSFVSMYGLSESRAQDVASLVTNWSDLSKKRQMTPADLKEFSSAVLGADLATFQTAADKVAKNGDTAQLDSLTTLAAKTNGISVEHARTILKGFLN